MERFAAFLRGMNLGGRRIKNDELRRVVVALGFDDVATFRASGNVVLTADGLDERAAAERLEAGLGRELGYEVPVFLRGEDELRRIAARDPFGPPAGSSKGKLQIVLLGRKPDAARRRGALALATDRDQLAVAGRELYWLPSGGLADADVGLKAIEGALGPNTVRTKGTIEQIVTRHFGD
jgi:uncharacterized protein (DUF1697 family)